jgi:hypothetical protein
MHQELLASLRQLSDRELLARVVELSTREREATVQLVAHLAELDTRDVHLRAGHGSLFAYCRDALALSEQEAYNRIAVARAARRFPLVLELLESGAVNLTTVRLLGPHLTSENNRSVLESARGKSKAQVEEIAAALWPRPDAPSFVRKLPGARPTAGLGGGPGARTTSVWAGNAASGPTVAPTSGYPGTLEASAAASSVPSDPGLPIAPTSFPATSPRAHVPQAGPPPESNPGPIQSAAAVASTVPGVLPPPARRSAEVTPLSPDRYRVQVTIGSQTLEKLRLAKDLLRHAVPSGDEAVIFDRALTALLADIAQKKFASAEKPRASGTPAAGSRHIPADVKRKVWMRDLGRCAFVGTGGKRCDERAFLEFHHVTPFALGGEASFDNIQLRCRRHNAYEARLYFGDGGGYGDGDGGGGGAGNKNGSGAQSVREPAAVYGTSSTRGGPARPAAASARIGARSTGWRTRSGTSSPTAALSRPGRLDRAATLDGTVAPKGRAP